MPIAEGFAYFDHAAVSPLPAPTRIAMETVLFQAEQFGDTRWNEWAMGVEKLRSLGAELLDATPEEIALIPNTTFGINVIVEGVPWQSGDNIVVPSNEFPSNLLPWRFLERRGVEVRVIPTQNRLEIDAILNRVDERTRVVSVSWVHYANGFRVDLAELCDRVQACGAKLFVDAIQGLGAFPLSVKEIPIDFLAADGHKWMLGPEGAGLLFIRQQHLEWLTPIMMGWGSVVRAYQFSPNQTELKKQASRYEGGSANMIGLIGLAASIELLLQAGCHRRESGFAQTILETTALLVENLQRIGAHVYRDANFQNQSGIVAFDFQDRDCLALRQKLLDENIVVSVRDNRLRAAIHAYNVESEVMRMIEVLSSHSF